MDSSLPTRLPGDNPEARLRFSLLFVAIVLCWFCFSYIHLYYLGYANMDSWTLAAPAAMAKAPFAITAPFLGTFDGSNRAWGLHWPGGPLLTSIFEPYLPHNPATYVAIYLCYWLLASLAAAAVAGRLTASRWIALGAFLLVAEDHVCFTVTWLQRYEDLGAAVAMAALLALDGSNRRNAGRMYILLGGAFFLLPLIHPVFSGLGFGWVVYLGIRTVALRLPWKQFCIAAGGYAAGWAAFLGYYLSRPWLYVQFRNHAQQNVDITRAGAPPGVGTFLRHLWFIDSPTHAATLIYLIAFAGILALGYGLLKSRRAWKEFLLRHDLAIFTALGLIGTLFLVQFSYNFISYWAAPWPFAAVMGCLVAKWLLHRLPRYRTVVIAGFVILLALHGAYLPARTYMWSKTGFVNLRARLRGFASTLPPQGRLFVPEVLWDTYAGGGREVFMNSLPYSAGLETQQRYAQYIASQMQPGDVLVIDQLQSHATLVDPTQPGWKIIGICKVVYQGQGGHHGFDMTAYQKE
jgi:hypothetical protein